jgi:hypothetical protein
MRGSAACMPRSPARTGRRWRSSPPTAARAPGGCAFAEDPARPAREARLFWDARIDPHVIVAHARPTDRADPQRFDILALPVPVTILAGPGVEELLLGEGDRTVRISIAEGSVLRGPARLAYQLAGTDALDRRLLALRRLAALQLRGRLPRFLFEEHARAGRWSWLVATLEALAIDPSHRAVATRLFGADTVAAEWDGRSDYLRSRVRRLVAEARHMATGGHVALLRR